MPFAIEDFDTWTHTIGRCLQRFSIYFQLTLLQLRLSCLRSSIETGCHNKRFSVEFSFSIGFFHRLLPFEFSLSRLSRWALSRPSSCGSGDLIRFRLSVHWTLASAGSLAVWALWNCFQSLQTVWKPFELKASKREFLKPNYQATYNSTFTSQSEAIANYLEQFRAGFACES